MLNNSSVITGFNLSEILASNNITLTAKNGTLLGELCSSIFNNIFSEVNDKDIIPDVVVNASLGKEILYKNVKSYSSSTHDAIMDNYIEDLKKIVTNHISFARNVVNREITNLINRVTSAINNYRFKEPEDFFNVTYYSLPELFKSYIIDDEIIKYSSGSKSLFEKLNLNEITRKPFRIDDYILIGEEEQDKLIKEWFSNIGENKALSYILDNIVEYSLSVPELLDYSMINYLFYRNLVIKADINTGNSIVALKSKAAINRDNFGYKVYLALESYKREIRNGYIFAVDATKKFSYLNKDQINIVIYEENFEKASEQGIGIETIFGYLSSNNESNLTLKKLVENKDKYTSNWINTKNLYLLYLNKNKVEIFKQILAIEFENSLNNLTESEKEVHNGNNTKILLIKKEASKYIDELNIGDMNDIEKICLDLVARIRFGFSDAYKILSEMKAIMGMNDDISPMEAALLSSIKYLSDFMIDQMDIIKH